MHSIFGNVGSWIVFRVGSTDAEILEKEFYPYFELEHMRRQGNHQIVYKLLVDGAVALPGATDTYPPIERQGNEAARDTIIRTSQERFCKDKLAVENKLASMWSLYLPNEKEARG